MMRLAPKLHAFFYDDDAGALRGGLVAASEFAHPQYRANSREFVRQELWGFGGKAPRRGGSASRLRLERRGRLPPSP
ncbi:MAG: hypothetical protein LBF77_01005, partial [Spirochaetaceae bacterium]|nr:hypothetical protein [Spirochaetaceae bacterium]